MDATLEALPPLKRFRLMQKQEEEEQRRRQQQKQKNQQVIESKAKYSCLPAKKRKECLYPPPFLSSESASSISSVTTYRLPAKKRVWAIQPDLLSDNPALQLDLDLNVEWKPSFKPETESKDESNNISVVKSSAETTIQQEHGKDHRQEKGGEDEEEEEEEEEDDGIVCAICQSTDGDSKDPIVFCDGCDLMVHATCYGNPLSKEIPEGDWFCAQCLATKASQTDNPNVTFSCCLCPVKGGAMKPTNDGSWGHVVCAVLVPEVFFEDPEGREGIDCSKVPKTRREKKCYVCKSKRGCAIECSEPKCCLSFHVTCGLNEDLCIEYREGKKGAVVAGFCKDHTELWKKQQQTGKYKIVAREDHKKGAECRG